MNEVDLKTLLKKEMTRKQFLGLAAFTAASVVGVTGMLRELRSHAATLTAANEAEDDAAAGKVVKLTDSTASGNGAVKFGVASSGGSVPGGAMTHGEQITLNSVGPWTLQGVAKGSEVLSPLSTGGERISTWPSDGRPSWIPATPYVYNNNPTNYGGVVPAGGLMIDGYQISAGTWVVQFRNFTDGPVISGDNSGTSAAWPGVLFRGCRMRGPWGAPGWFNMNAQSSGGKTWIMYADAGGKSTAAGDYCESIFESQHTPDGKGNFYVIRSYLSNASTLVFLRQSGDAAIENYGENVLDFGDHTKHLNGIANGGGENATLWLRNHIVLAQQSGSTQVNDVVQMAADGGGYLGTWTNLDGSQGYTIKDNYLAGAAHTLQLGYDKSNAITQVRNVHVVGNKFSTSLYANSGETGLAYKTPDFSNYGNVWSGNTWADGSRAGQTISAPAASN